MRLIPVQFILVPISLVLSTFLIAAGWGHNSVHEVSPVLGSSEAVQRWIDHEARAQKCLAWSVNVDTVNQDALPTDPGKGHWFTTLRCNRRSIEIQWAIMFFTPWLIMNAVLMFFTWRMPSPKQKNYDHFR